jgi:hypothetical protein
MQMLMIHTPEGILYPISLKRPTVFRIASRERRKNQRRVGKKAVDYSMLAVTKT